MNDARWDPDDLLARLRVEEPEALGEPLSRHGRLKIFFGYAAGVGKTYTMLEAGRAAARGGRDVLLGYIEPHGRPETEALLIGQELLPSKEIDYRGVTLREFDIDAALARKPEIILVDELAHTNAGGCRHNKRWQDVQELLDAGVDVWTTLNVQHVESLNDIVAQITSVVVRETIPDRVFDEAAEIELVDLPPAELLERFREGKVYVPEQAERAAERFFRKANLIALRELAMRRVADRVSREVQTARLGHTRTQTWPTTERLLVCVGPSPTSAKVIRTAKRMAAAMHAQWIAVHTETVAQKRLDDRGRHRLALHLKLAEQLGAETVTLTGEDVVEEIVRYAQSRNVTKIVIGKTGQTPWYRFWRRSIVDRLIAMSGDIDVYVIRGVEERLVTTSAPTRKTSSTASYWGAAGLMVPATVVAAIFDALGLTHASLVMTYLLAVVLVAAWWGRWPAIAASLAAVLLYNFFFTTPYYTFTVDDPEHIYTFIVMLVIALLVSALTARIRDQVTLSRERERRTEALYRVSHSLAGTSGRLQLVAVAQEQLAAIFGGQVVLFVPEDGSLRPLLRRGQDFAEAPAEIEAARWVFEHRQPAGRGTDTLPSVQAIYLPLVGTDVTVGVLAWRPSDNQVLLDLERRQLLDAFATQIALALERDRLAQEAQRILAQAETEKLRSSLLSAVSHDLRTPLATIAGASSSLLGNDAIPPGVRRELLQSIWEESDRLARLVENLLQMTRIESGNLNVRKDWQPMDEVIGSALHRMERMLAGHPVETDVPADLPMVPMDGLLIEQVLINLLENAARYSRPGTVIRIESRRRGEAVETRVLDGGPGLAAEDRERIFEKFYRGTQRADASRGAGLGLAICRAIIQAHGGTIRAEARTDGDGASLAFTLPLAAESEMMEANVPTASDDRPQAQGS